MSTLDEPLVLLAPEEEAVPESALHQRTVDLFYAGLAAGFASRADVAVHSRLAWFPDRADTRIRLDPDVLVVFGRPPQDRSSYRAWDEEGVQPTVFIEVRSDHDTDADYRERLQRAREYGVEEVVIVAPFAPGGLRVEHLVAADDSFRVAAISASAEQTVAVARLGITLTGGTRLTVRDADGIWPDTPTAFSALRAEAARADAEAARADAEAARAERLATRLRDAGLTDA